MKIKFPGLLILPVFIIAALSIFSFSSTPSKETFVKIETSSGDMLIKLYDETPQHRDNFLKLVKEGFYNELLFHRVIPNFMIQGGDPESKGAPSNKSLGSGGPGYTIPAEINSKFIHKKGSLAAARQGDQVNPEKRSSGSQFYIVQGQSVNAQMLESLAKRKNSEYTPEQIEEYKELGGTPHLDGEYTVFGEVVEGLDVIDKIAATKTDGRNRPQEDIWMKMEIVKK